LLRPRANRISAGGGLSAQFNFAACAGDVIAQLVVDSTHLGTSQPSGSDDRMPEEHSEKSNDNNPKDKIPRVAIKGLSCEVSRSGSLMRDYSVARQPPNLTRHC
jgi:hypothetical protein